MPTEDQVTCPDSCRSPRTSHRATGVHHICPVGLQGVGYVFCHASRIWASTLKGGSSCTRRLRECVGINALAVRTGSAGQAI